MKIGKRILSLLLVVVLLLSTSVAVFAEAVLAIDIAALPAKLTYAEGEALDVTGGTLTVYYSGSQEIIPITEDMVTGFDSTVPGTQTLTVTYAEQTTTFRVEIQAKTLIALMLAQAPTKTTYLLGEEALDLTGGQMILTYSNGASETMDITADMVSGFDGNTAGVQTITVAYGGLSTTYRVEVFETGVASLSVAQRPAVTKYLLATDALDVTGGELSVRYNNGITATIPMRDEMVSGFDNTVLGEQRLTVTYAGKTTGFTVEICQENTAEFFGGLGTANRPYLIKTKDHLNHVRNDLDAHYMMIADIEFTEADFSEGGTFHNDGAGWQPIGTLSMRFTGYFDGNGHTIQGLQISISGDSTVYAGLFGYAVDCAIKSLDMVDSCIKAEVTSGSAHVYAGGIVGGASGSTITDCCHTGSLTAATASNDYQAQVGGIAGDVRYSTITDCRNTGTVSSNDCAGGIVGSVHDSYFTNCCNEGSVTATSTSGSSNAYAGGIVGSVHDSFFTNCCNVGSVTAISTSSHSYANAGGIAESAYDSFFTNCCNVGSVTATAESSPSYSDAYAGGIVEYANDSSFTNCCNEGNVTAAPGSSDSDSDAGGIAVVVYDSFFTNCRNEGSVSASWKTGGIAGIAHDGSFMGCYNTGSVTVKPTANQSHGYAGGIVGEAYSSSSTTTITNCYNTGNVTATSKYSWVGGIAGLSQRDIIITDCYNTGRVTATSAFGGILGYANSTTITITDCYYLNIACQGVGYGTDAATACTYEQMKQQETFAGFDFETVWTMDAADAYPLPTLRSHSHVEKEEDTVNFAGGNGSYLNPYRIASKEHLNWVRNYPNACFVLTGDIVFTEADFAEDGAFCHGGTGWQPIGTASEPFMGSFDGNGHTIRGLQINITGDGAVYAGLFGFVENGTIQNLHMADSVIHAESVSNEFNIYAGGIAAYVKGSTAITGCSNTGSITAQHTSDERDAGAGGIAGFASGGTLRECCNTGAISSSRYSGGIVGRAQRSTVTDCCNMGGITFESKSAYAGGIAGSGYEAMVSSCYNTGSVKMLIASGGIVGDNYRSTVADCYYLNIIDKGVGFETDTATACTYEQMKLQETFAGFDFATVWTMEGNEDFPFPELQRMPTAFADRVAEVRIATLPDKLIFTEGASLEVSGGVLEVSYISGRSLEVPIAVSMVTGFDPFAPGEQILTVTYEGKTTTYTVTVTHSYESEWSQDETCHWHACSVCGDKTDKTEHVYDNDCDTTCNACDYTRTITHSFGAWVVTKEPTCTEKGEETRTCDTCGKTETREAEALGHDYKDTVTDPTCTEQGYTTHTCSRCDDSYVDTYVEALGHDLGAWTETKAATCTEKGAERRDCSRCEHYETREVEALGHAYKDAVTDPTCTEQGYTTHTCSRCNDSYVDTYVEALGHDLGAWAETKAATCMEKGEERRDCSRCEHYETREVEALGHDYKAVVTDPTCAEQGYTTHTCSRCDDSYVDTYVDALGHDLGEWAESKAPTCTEKGEGRRDCSRCEYYETREVEALGHDYKAVVTDPSCTEQGYTTHTCSRCNDSYADTYVDALGHAWDDGVVTKQPTATENGVKTYTCTRCDATRTESIPATGEKPCDGGEGCQSGKFVDVDSKQWYHPAVDYAVEHGLFGGTSANTFEPETAMTRAMLVTVLWRYEGQPKGYQNTFSDVNAKSGSWYIDAVAWASANGVVNGVGAGRFDPDGKITREQMATILFRYAQKKEIDTNRRGDVSAFPDADQISGYAKEALSWTVGEGIINGSDNMLQPRGNATRAQVATILMRFMENIA